MRRSLTTIILWLSLSFLLEAQDIDELLTTEVAETVVVAAQQDQINFDRNNPGSSLLNKDLIESLGGPTADPNEILQILSNTQFDSTRERLNAGTIADLTPAELSISGGRPYENNFVIDGASTNNLLDSLSRRGFDSVEASNQAVFIDADLLRSIEVFDSSVPAEYGDFIGGAVIAKTRDPSEHLSATLSSRYSSSSLTSYLIDEEILKQILTRTAPEERKIPDKTEFERKRFQFSMDFPINNEIKALGSYGRQIARVTRGALSSSYFLNKRPRDTVRENFFLKLQSDPSPNSSISIQTLLTPYRDEYWRSSLGRQYGGGTSSSLEWKQQLSQSSVTTNASYTTSENSRREEPVHFIYDNTPSISWIPGNIFSNPDARRSGLKGGFGNLDVSQKRWEISLKHDVEIRNSRLIYGVQGARIRGLRSRPQTNYSYRDALSTFGLPISASNLDDGTIIQNEQFLQERNDYLPYRADVVINQATVFGTWAHNFKLTDWLTIKPSLGMRYSYDDFLENDNLAPRLNINFNLPLDVGLSIGANRYYAKNQLLYALREQNPDNFVYKRDFRFEEGRFLLDDWKLYAINRPTSFTSSNLKTPYADELSATLSLRPWKFGELRLKGISRDNSESFARSEPIPDMFIDQNGHPAPFNRYELTNRGFSQYQSLSVDWRKSWRNHIFMASTTFSENVIAPGTDTLLSNTDLDRLNELIRYNNKSIPYRELDIQREKFNTPFYITFSWISRWFGDRLTVALHGRFRDSYASIEATGDFEDGLEVYEDRKFQSRFLVDGSVSYIHDCGRLGTVELELFVDNIFNSFPKVGVTRFNPYQTGRSFSVGARYRF